MPTLSRARWHSWSPTDEVHRRAGGRRRHNWQRQIRVELRRNEVAKLLGEVGWPRHGCKAELARRLGVDRSTISRDVAAIHAEWLVQFRAETLPLRPPSVDGEPVGELR